MMEENFQTRYKILNRIGEGVHGVVIKAIDLTNNQLVAIKKIPLKTKYGGISPYALREIKILQHCDCEYFPNDEITTVSGNSKVESWLNSSNRKRCQSSFDLMIVSLLDIYPDISGLSLVCEFMPFTLYSKLKDETTPLERKEIKSYTKMIFRGLEYLHDIGIMHRDIKPSNLLINEMGILKIADFGLSRLYHKDEHRCYSPQVASRWYRPPELLWGSPNYGPAIDMWATGCVFAEMLRGEPIFAGNTDIEQLALVVRTLGTPNHKIWPEVKQLPDYNKIRFPESKGEPWDKLFPANTTRYEISLVDGLVKYNPKMRLTASEALSHKYFVE